MPAVDPYKQPSRLVNQRNKEAQGPPDLKKPFVRDRKGKPKKPAEPDPEPTQDDTPGDLYENDDGSDFDVRENIDNDTSDDLPPMPKVGDTRKRREQEPEPLQNQTYVPPDDPEPDPQSDELATLIDSLAEQNQLAYTNNVYMRKYLEAFAKYLKYQNALIVEQDEINAAASKGLITPAQAGSGKKQPVVNSLATDKQILSEEESKKQKRNTILKIAIGVLMICAGIYCATLAQLTPIIMTTILLCVFGGAFLVNALFKQ